MRHQVTLEDVAKLAGVHKATVSRALNPDSQVVVSQKTVRRVLQAAESLGYVRNLTARSLRVNATMTVGVVVPDLTNPIFPPIVRGIEDYLAGYGYTVLLADTDESQESEELALRSLSERRVDGFIVATGTDDHDAIPDLFERGVPVVLVNRGAGMVPFPLVTGDDESGIRQVVSHLKSLGHRKIVHLAGPRNLSTTRVRADTMARVCAKEGLSCTIVPVDGLRVEAGEKAVNALLKDGADFTAIQAATDLVALGALRALRQHGVSCPGEVSVVGFNDMPFASEFSPGLTTVRVPLEKIGQEGARLLVERLTEGTVSSSTLSSATVALPVELVVRNSTGPAPVATSASKD